MHIVLLADDLGRLVTVGPFESEEAALTAVAESPTPLTFAGTAPCGPDMNHIPTLESTQGEDE